MKVAADLRLSFDAADRITYDTLVYYKQLLEGEVRTLSKIRKLPRYKQEDLDNNRLYLISMEKVLEYFKPMDSTD